MNYYTSHSTSTIKDILKDKAFYFYNGIDRPNGKVAMDLQQFYEILKAVDIESIEFHLYREDFEKWLRAIGEENLTAEVSKIRMGALSGESCRRGMCEVVGAHLRE